LDEIGLVVYEEMSFKVKVYGRTTDGRRTKSDHKSSPCHFVTGELKIRIAEYWFLYTTLFLNEIYHPMKFKDHRFYTLGEMA
jgi:hypothetical protein